MSFPYPEKVINLLGRKAKDKVTGFNGVITSVCFDLYGCTQAIIQPPINNDGKYEENGWFDINRLELLGEDHVMPVPKFVEKEIADNDTGPANKPRQYK